ncbi:MAG: YceI family protein [Crocinitomicaceae bacterium]|nr:YceI family protein [Crocinitomicaceae bacterium]
MKKAIFVAAGMSVLFSFSSCKGDSTEVDNAVVENVVPACFYSYNEGSTNFQWTAFKTTAKVAVVGGFNEIEVTSESSDDAMAVLNSMAFKMNTASVETNNEERNLKIATNFFETINTSEIIGNVVSIDENGKCVININMNGMSIDVEGDYTFENNKFTFDTMIDVASWNAITGIDALNEICKDLHTGEDGISKLWSEVQLSFSTTLKSDC